MADLLDNPFVDVALAQSDPMDAAKVVKAIRKSAERDNAPSAKQVTQATPLTTLDQVMGRFNVERIPISRLRQMRRDPTLAFALFFVRAHLMRARWRVESIDPQVASFVDNALREIYPSLITQFCQKLDFGWQAVIQRFGLANPDWVYFDPESPEQERRAWDEGSIDAVVWKPFAALPPESADPIWANDGSFDGIKFKPSAVGQKGEDQEYGVIDSLWFTNELESVHGNLFGYPRLGFAYRFWWSFWFDWGLADRHFEKDADPPIKVFYPPGSTREGDAVVQNRSRALQIGQSARSNSTIALPSTALESADGRLSTLRQWDIDFLKGGGNFEAFRDRFEQVQKFMLRALMVPESAFENRGGTAGYNATTSLQDTFAASQVILMQEFDFALNRYVIPRLVLANFGDRVKDQGLRVKKVTTGFDVEDIDMAKEILRGVANKEPSSLNVDLDHLLDAVGIPRLTGAALEAKREETERGVRESRPNPVDAIAGRSAGVTEEGLYYAPRERIDLDLFDDGERMNLAELRKMLHMQDDDIMRMAQGLREIWRTNIQRDYDDAAALAEDYAGVLSLDETFFERWRRKASDRVQETVAQTRRVLMSIMRRSARVEFERAGLSEYSWDPLYSEAASRYLQDRGAELVEGIVETTREEVRAYLSDLVRRGVPDRDIPHLLRSHFMIFGQHRADRVARTEVARAYNMATLLAAQDVGIKQVQALDAQLGPSRSDDTCIARNGRVFNLEEAFEENEKEHPQGTLQWRLLKRPTRKKRLPVPADVPGGFQ